MKRLTIIAAFVLTFSTIWANWPGWYKFPSIGKDIEQVVESTEKIYYLSDGTLYSFNPADQESYAYNNINTLSDINIKRIEYNYDKKYLLIVYDNANLDLLYDDGRLVNMPDIKNAQLSVSKTINDIAFGSDRIAIATSFGLVIFDDDKHEVRESAVYDTPIENIAVMGDQLLIKYRPSDGLRCLYHAPLADRHNSIDKFKKMGGAYVNALLPISDNVVLLYHTSDQSLSLQALDFASSSMSRIAVYPGKVVSKPQRYADGAYACTADKIVAIDATGFQETSIPEMLQGQKLAMHDDLQRVWAGNAEGVARYDISGATPTVLYDRMLHPDAMSCSRVGYLRPSADGKRIYASNNEVSQYRSLAMGEGKPYCQTTNIIEDGFAREASLRQATADHRTAQSYQKEMGDERMYGDPQWIVEDPDDPDKYYIATNVEGVYVAKYDASAGEYKEIGKFTHGNTSMPAGWGGSTRTYIVDVDPQGNLWIGTLDMPYYHMLPAAKRRQDPATVTAADWRPYTPMSVSDIGHKDMMSLFCKKSTMAFFVTAKYNGGLVAVDTKGTYDDFDDDVVRYYPNFTDQDGNVFSATRCTFLLEDRRGCVWVGTDRGIFEITNPSEATGATLTVKRMKVARNDGTIYADYLLDSEQVNYMAEDPSGRKWVATENSGVFLVSENGDAILRNFTIENSPLPSNTIASVACDALSNTVYIGTYNGLYSYLSDSAPASDDYSDMYAYPNPVRPDYYGDVTFAGLMENSVVKICDQSGNVVYETRGEGGMATWPVTNAAGARVKSGVYYAFASSHNGSSKGKATKILVIN